MVELLGNAARIIGATLNKNKKIKAVAVTYRFILVIFAPEVVCDI